MHVFRVTILARFLFVLFALLLNGCETHPKHVSTTEKLSAAAGYLLCLHKAAAELDDHVSEVSKIAPAVAYRCNDAFRAGAETLTRGMSSVEEAIFLHKAERENLKLATAALHEERLEHENRNQPALAP